MPYAPLNPLVSQYAASPTIIRLLEDFSTWIVPDADIDAWYDLVWNVATAQGYGLDVWGRIVDVGRVVLVASGEITLGFEESNPSSAVPFGEGVFFNGGSSTSNYALPDADYRTLIYAKALSNICDGSIPSANRILRLLFPGRGNCYVTDGLDMTMTYTFEFPLTAVELAILAQSNVLATPSGIVATINVI
jgi:hypothetical protein